MLPSLKNCGHYGKITKSNQTQDPNYGFELIPGFKNYLRKFKLLGARQNAQIKKKI